MQNKRLLRIILMVSAFFVVTFFSQNTFASEYKDADYINASIRNETSVLDDYTFTEKSAGKWIPIYPQGNGILRVGEDIQVYDKDKKCVTGVMDGEDKSIFIPDVSKTDIYYIKLPDYINDSITFYVGLEKDNASILEDKVIYTQSGQGKNIHQKFILKKRSRKNIYIRPVSYNKKDVNFYLQKNEDGKWKTITDIMTSVANDHEQCTFTTGLEVGEYRIVSKAPKGQVYRIVLSGSSSFSKYSSLKSKACQIKLKKTTVNIYTVSEKKQRWYKVYKATSKEKRYMKFDVSNNSGKFKFSIYKNGQKKAVASFLLSGNKAKSYRLNSGKGTYYVKVNKIGDRTNGMYSIQYK